MNSRFTIYRRFSSFLVPSSPPRAITAMNYLSNEFVDVSWTSIPQEKWNGDRVGIYLGYWISKRGAEYTADKTRTVVKLKSDQRFHRVTGLDVNMEVGIELYGFTKVGNGTVSSPVYGSK